MRYFVLLVLLSLTSACVTSVDSDGVKGDQQPAFSIAKSVGVNGSFILMGNMIDCNIKWEAQGSVLTHRSNCKHALKEDVLELMTAMAFKFKAESPVRIDFIRFTSKDFRAEENRLAKMMTQSRVWNQYSSQLKKSNLKKNKDFQNNFLKKVFEKKKVFALVPVAFKKAGYKFEYDQIEVTKMREVSRSRHRNQLVDKFKPKSSLVIPEDIKVVLKRAY